MTNRPPKHALTFLRWFCREDYVEEIEGDLTELFEKDLSWSPRAARWKFAFRVISYLRPAFLKSFKFHNNSMLMIRHNLKVTYRTSLRHKTTFSINLLGLAIGLACALLIYLWVYDEYSVDRFHEHDARLYQVMKTAGNADGTIHTHETTPGLLAHEMALAFPEITYAASVVFEQSGILSTQGKFIKAKPIFASPAFLQMFTYPLIQGERKPALNDKLNILISDELSMKLFNTTDDIIGKTLVWDGEDAIDGNYVISGIFRTPPKNASMQFDVLFSYSLYYDTFRDNYGLNLWYSNNPSTYLLLAEGTDVNSFNEKIKDFAWQKYKAAHGEVHKSEGQIFLRRYADQYLYDKYDNGVQAGGRIEYVRIFTLIAVAILVIACINFMNLATAQASRRLKEVGVKKAIGANRKHLIGQHLSESVVMAGLAMIIAITIVILFLPQFNQITGKHLRLDWNTNLFLALFSIVTVTGILAGSYPAFYLSSFSPVSILKGKLLTTKINFGEAWARKGLVVLQFCISIILIVCVLVVYRQIDFIHSKNLGYDKDNLISFPSDGKIRENQESFLEQLRRIPGVVNASSMAGDLVGNHSGGGGITWPGKVEGQGIEFDGLDVEYDVIQTLGLTMKEGRFFSREFSNEKEKVIFNEAAIEAMRLENPIGQTVTMWGKQRQIVGVVKDFHFKSLYENVGPFFFRFSNENDNILVKIRQGAEYNTLEKLERFYRDYNLGLPFEYKFLDEDCDKLYASEQRVSILSRYFAFVAVLISCLGIFSLAAFTAERRIKEIGIRKILGSSEWNIVYLLSRDFTQMVFISIVLALPISFFITKSWLDSFAYRTTLEIWFFVAAGLAALLVTWATVGTQTLKAARIKPTDCLRSE